jgi:hypothetical protein
MSHEEISMKWTFVSAVNNEAVLKSCLFGSSEINLADEVMLQRGFKSAAEAYNSAIDEAKTDLLIFIHQDVYLPDGWLSNVREAIKKISKTDPEWGVLGVWGMRSSGEGVGYVYDGAWNPIKKVLGNKFEGGIEVDSLDEVVLILRKSAGLYFDSHLPGYHMYGTDICQEAKRRGRKCYAISAFCIHNTSQYAMLPWQFWQSYLLMRCKWKSQLPLRTPCTKITYWCWPMLRWNIVRAINLVTGRDKPPTKRVEEPSKLYAEMLLSGTIP